jgi:hypothetical protein
LANTIIAFGLLGEALYCMGTGAATLACSDVYGNAGGDWIGCIADQAMNAGNFSADPVSCDPQAGDLSLADNSPCLPGNHPNGADCGLIGALGEGCFPPVPTAAVSWGDIKARYGSSNPH